MKLIFVSNFFNHYQRPLAEEFVKIYGEDYAFIAMTPFDKERLAIGFSDMNQYPFVLRAYESREAAEKARRLILDSDCVIIGGMPVSVVSERLAQNKLTFMQSERFFKGPLWKDAVRFVKYRRYSGGRRQAGDPRTKFYLLCASAYAAWDYNTCGLFKNKAYRWAYFPAVKKYDDVDEMISRKEQGSILWAGRFLEWKHPDLAVKLAANLKASHKSFKLKIIGSGEMQNTLAQMINSLGVNDCVELCGALPVERVRAEMERAQIFLFTSDRGEGWGVVLNEAMNSGCVAVSSGKTGSAPYLVRHGGNGLIFRDKSLSDLTEKVSSLLDEPARMCELGRRAYETISGEWSAETAAGRFIELADRLRESDEPVRLWSDGPGSPAPVI